MLIIGFIGVCKVVSSNHGLVQSTESMIIYSPWYVGHSVDVVDV